MQARNVTINTAITDKQVIARRDYAEMMKRAHLWSYDRRILPLQRRNSDGTTTEGFMVDRSDDPPFRVRLGNIFAASFSGKPISEMPYVDFKTAEAAVAAGWEVD